MRDRKIMHCITLDMNWHIEFSKIIRRMIYSIKSNWINHDIVGSVVECSPTTQRLGLVSRTMQRYYYFIFPWTYFRLSHTIQLWMGLIPIPNFLMPENEFEPRIQLSRYIGYFLKFLSLSLCITFNIHLKFYCYF